MSFQLCRRDELSAPDLAKLEKAMAAFYQNPPASYYAVADKATGEYNSKDYPFHWNLVGHVLPSARVLEMGCGTAHLCPYVEKRGGIYTGIDHSEDLLEKNRRRFPNAHFQRIGMPLENSFDIVASLYTLEHIVDPPAYLEKMWNYCRPGGLLAIICPELIDCPVFPQSVFFGWSARRLRQKLQTVSLGDAFAHLIDWKIRSPSWRKRLRFSGPGAFWMNLQPAVLHGAEYTIDADAVHLTRMSDIIWYFERQGASIIQNSAMMDSVPAEILRFNCYVLARKPTDAT